MTDGFPGNLGIRICRGAPIVMRISIIEEIPLLNLTGILPFQWVNIVQGFPPLRQITRAITSRKRREHNERDAREATGVHSREINYGN